MKLATKIPNTTNQTSEKQEGCDCTHAPQSECCNKETQIYSRVVGYIRPTDHWNVAKKEEFENRQTYKINKDEK